MAIAIGAHAHLQATTAAATQTTAGVTTQATGSTFVIHAAVVGAGTFGVVNDNKGNTYTLTGSEIVAGSTTKCRRYICENGVGGSGHTVSVAITPNEIALIYFDEITGAATASVDQAPAGIDDTASPFTSNTTGTTAQAAELLLACAFTDTPSGTETITWGASFVQIDADGNSTFITGGVASRVVAATGTYQSSITSSVATSAVSFLTTFKEAASAGLAVPRNVAVLVAVSTASNF